MYNAIIILLYMFCNHKWDNPGLSKIVFTTKFSFSYYKALTVNEKGETITRAEPSTPASLNLLAKEWRGIESGEKLEILERRFSFLESIKFE